MTVGEVKELLRSAWWVNKRRELEEEYLGTLRARAESANALQYDKIAVQGGAPVPEVEACALAIVEAERKCLRIQAELTAKEQQVERLIDSLSDADGILRDILVARYRDFKRWEAIAEQFGYSWRQVYRLHSKALRKLAGPQLKRKEQKDGTQCHIEF